jgi:hypothetical protein
MSAKWSLVGNYLITWSNYTNFYDNSTTSYTYGAPNNPNQAIYSNASVSLYTFKVFGTYNAPWGFVITPIYRLQQGAPLQREITLSGLNIGQITVPTGALGQYRQDNVSILDTRVEKEIKFGERFKVGIFFDAFNMLNSNAAQSQDNITGRRTATVDNQTVNYQRFLSPTNIISPRIFRIGGKFTF